MKEIYTIFISTHREEPIQLGVQTQNIREIWIKRDKKRYRIKALYFIDAESKKEALSIMDGCHWDGKCNCYWNGKLSRASLDYYLTGVKPPKPKRTAYCWRLVDIDTEKIVSFSHLNTCLIGGIPIYKAFKNIFKKLQPYLPAGTPTLEQQAQFDVLMAVHVQNKLDIIEWLKTVLICDKYRIQPMIHKNKIPWIGNDKFYKLAAEYFDFKPHCLRSGLRRKTWMKD